MKKILIHLFITFSLIGCTSNVELYKTNCKGLIAKENTYVYENDTIKITYSFWTNNGLMAFSVYNKLEKPIYIDWKKSNYISNSNKFNYWEDKETSKRTTTNFEYLNKGYLSVPYLLNYQNSSISNTVSIKPERITFIPPKTVIYKSDYFITTNNHNKWNDGFQKQTLVSNDKKKSKYEVKIKIFSYSNTPLLFRNFITYSTKENFNEEYYVDNEFFVNEISLIPKNKFQTTSLKRDNSILVKYNFEDGKNFFKTVSSN